MSAEGDEAVKQSVMDVVERKIVEHKIIFPEGQGQGDEGKTKQQLEEELKQRNAMIESLALREFEDEKQALAEEFPDLEDWIEENIDSGSNLEVVRDLLARMKPSGEPRKPPSGKVSVPPETGGRTVSGTHETTQALINDIYDRIEEQQFWRAFPDQGTKHDPKKLAQLEALRTKLLASLVQGEKNRDRITPFRAWQCLCGANVVNSAVCPDCGFVYKGFKERPEGKVVV